MIPRRLAHRGTVVATGFVIDPVVVGDAEARRRVVSRWRPGVRVREHHGQLVVTGLRPQRVRTAFAPGAPLVEQHGALAAMPLDPDEAKAFANAVVIARGGVAEELAAGEDLDVVSWIEIDDFEVIAAAPLADAPARATLPAPPSTDVRALTGAPSAEAGANEAGAALRRALTGAPAADPNDAAASTARGSAPSMWSRFARWISRRGQAGASTRAPRAEAADRATERSRRDRAGVGASSLWQRLARWWSRPAQSPKALPAAASTEPPRPSLLARLRSKLAEALWMSRLGNALGRRHAEYLRNMIELFDRGELDEALRRAIPLGGDGDGNARLGLAMPRRRDSLSLTFGARRAGSVIPVADMAMDMMRARYRDAAARLERGGRIDEAAFVFAELLNDPEAAIALLERHGRYAIAARLAEARGLDAGLVVRLWFLAGEHQRAIDLARTRQAWAAAVSHLERRNDDRGAALRLLWADHLAEAGDFVAAVEAAWPVTTAGALVEVWIDRGIAVGGTAAARLLVKKLVGAPAKFAEVMPSVLDILAPSEPDGPRQRVALVGELVASPSSPELQTIARPALRALLRDCGAGADAKTSELVDRLVRFADDAALRADRPSLPAPQAPAADAPPLSLRWSASDAGTLPVYDAAFLPGNRLLLALGELGVRVVARDGRTLAHIDQPAARLVVADHGARALAIAPRGQVHRIARLDLVDRRGAHWCDAELDQSASTYDGDLWLVTRGREVLAIDTTAPRWRAVWGVAVDPAHARPTVRRDGNWFAVAVSYGDALEHWYYEGFTLRARKPWARSGVAQVEHVVPWPRRRDETPFVVRDIEDPSLAVEIAGDLVATHVAATVSACRLGGRELATLLLEGATTASMRLSGTLLTVGDDRGRVIVVDLAGLTVRLDLRTA